MSLKNILRLMRVRHYLKNVLVLLPLVFSGGLFGARLPGALLGFLAFSLTASAVYVFNDLRDVERDRLHEVKRKRPLASGAVSVRTAWVLLVVLFAVSLALGAAVAGWAALYLALYAAINIAYSLGLKNVPLLDIAILVGGFLLRIVFGAALVDVEISSWLYLTVMSASFYLGLGKRRNEILRQGVDARAVLRHYTHAFLDKNMYMCLALTIVFYALWCVDPLTIARHGVSGLVWTVPLVVLILMKYSLNVEGESQGDPVDVVLGDKVLLALAVLYAAVTLGVIYYKPLMIIFGGGT